MREEYKSSKTYQILLDHVLKLPKHHQIHTELPLQILTHLMSCLIGFMQLEVGVGERERRVGAKNDRGG
jgi:hypothetical protein